VAIGLVGALALDAITRESFTAFPTAYLGMLLIGLALATAREADEEEPAAGAVPARKKARARSRRRPITGVPRPGATGA
jgi:hypothetical protein